MRACVPLLLLACGDPGPPGADDAAASAAESGPQGANDAAAFRVETGAQAEPTTPFGDFCAAERDQQCSALATCCEAAGFPFEPGVCARELFARGSGAVAHCGSRQTPANFDPDAAARCLELTAGRITGGRTDGQGPEAGVGPAESRRYRRRDDPVTVEAARICERVATFESAPAAAPANGDGAAETPCEDGACFAPPGMVSVCNIASDSSGPFFCTDPEPRGRLGGRCGRVAVCDFGLRCSDADDHTCTELLADGGECNQNSECSSGQCADLASPFVRVCEPFRAVSREDCEVFTERR